MKTAAQAWWKMTTAILSVALLCLIAACHSYHIEATVENHTGGAVTLLEVDYSTASFGIDTLDRDGVYHHRIQTRDSGPVSVQFTDAARHVVQVKGPDLFEKQEGSIEIVLLPAGKAEFHPALSPNH